MKIPENIAELSKLSIDYMGLIFYSQSLRYAGDLDPQMLDILPQTIKKTGVFVNEETEYILKQMNRYGLDCVQLHGKESVEAIKKIKEKRPEVHIIKAFSISEASDFNEAGKYENVCDYFLFDTKTSQYGGSGHKFDWQILDFYHRETPFFLSGGISPEDAEDIKKLSHSQLYAIDINSRFEIEPGIKNIMLVEEFSKKFKNT